jgi:hypothetical protein
VHPKRQEVPIPQKLWKIVRTFLLDGIDDEDDDTDGNQWQETKINTLCSKF